MDTGALPARGPGAHPGEARGAAGLGAAGLLRGDAQGDGARPRGAAGGVLRRVRRRGRRRRLDRPGLPRAAARRPARRGQGPVPGRRRRGPRRPAEPRADPARGQALAPGIDAKSMAREISERITEELDYEHEAQSHRPFARTWRGHPFVVHPRRGHAPVPRARARHRVGGRRGLRGRKERPRRSATASARSSSASSSARSTAPGTSPATRTPATTCCSPTAAWRSSTSA